MLLTRFSSSCWFSEYGILSSEWIIGPSSHFAVVGSLHFSLRNAGEDFFCFGLSCYFIFFLFHRFFRNKFFQINDWSFRLLICLIITFLLILPLDFFKTLRLLFWNLTDYLVCRTKAGKFSASDCSNVYVGLLRSRSLDVVVVFLLPQLA